MYAAAHSRPVSPGLTAPALLQGSRSTPQSAYLSHLCIIGGVYDDYVSWRTDIRNAVLFALQRPAIPRKIIRPPIEPRLHIGPQLPTAHRQRIERTTQPDHRHMCQAVIRGKGGVEVLQQQQLLQRWPTQLSRVSWAHGRLLLGIPNKQKSLRRTQMTSRNQPIRSARAPTSACETMAAATHRDTCSAWCCMSASVRVLAAVDQRPLDSGSAARNEEGHATGDARKRTVTGLSVPPVPSNRSGPPR